jgi:hypothetical protein
VSSLLKESASKISVSLKDYLLTFAIYPTRLYLAMNLNSASLYPQSSPLLSGEFSILQNAMNLFETIHPVVGLLQMVLRTFEDPNDYLIYALHTLGFIQSSENERNPAFFTFLGFLLL